LSLLTVKMTIMHHSRVLKPVSKRVGDLHSVGTAPEPPRNDLGAPQASN
jgi:hypothetical protein